MNIDLSAIIAFVSGINPTAAAVVAAVIFVVQHLGAKQGANLTLAGLINFVYRLIGKNPGDPALSPNTPSDPAAPVTPIVPSAPAVDPANDPLADKPVRKFLRDLALKMLAEKVGAVLASAKDDEDAALKVFSAFKPKDDKPAAPGDVK